MPKNPNSKRSIEESFEEYFDRCVKQNKEKEAKRRNCLYWSQLPPDLIHSVLQRLSIPDLQRAKSVCSSWYSSSRNCFPKSQIPWLIIFPHDKVNRCKLFNPNEKDKIYTSRDLGIGFAEDVCVTTYGYFLLMRNPLFNLYILNLLTGQRISLPPVESQLGETKLERIVGNKFRATRDYIYARLQTDSIGFKIKSAQLWIDEEARDYLVIFSLKINDWSAISIICKKGDHLWRELPYSSDCRKMVYKHPKLYVLRYSMIHILDLSGELPRKAPETDVYVASFLVKPSSLRPSVVKKTKFVVTVSGDVLMVTMRVMISWKACSFLIYKMSSKKNKWERLLALADEAIILDLGVTVNAKDVEGIRDSSIYFTGLVDDAHDIFIFDLKTEKIERPQQAVCSSLQYSHARWSFPCFSRNVQS